MSGADDEKPSGGEAIIWRQRRKYWRKESERRNEA